jgi:hypothetical protein
MYISGLRTGGMLHFNGKSILMSAELPPGTHNARPFRDGVLFNDSNANTLRYAGRHTDAEDRVIPVPEYPVSELLNSSSSSSRTRPTATLDAATCWRSRPPRTSVPVSSPARSSIAA